jgi:hypothetical protein
MGLNLGMFRGTLEHSEVGLEESNSNGFEPHASHPDPTYLRPTGFCAILTVPKLCRNVLGAGRNVLSNLGTFRPLLRTFRFDTERSKQC